MTKRERLEAAFRLEQPDRTPILGGWIAAPEHIQQLTGTSESEYWRDPVGVSIAAYDVLEVDGLIDVFVPKDRGYRCVDSETFFSSEGRFTLSQALEDIERMPGPTEIESAFDADSEYERFRNRLLERQALCGDMVWMPAQWDASAKISWYGRYGYENFFYIVGAHLDHARKLLEIGGARGRCQSHLVARAVREGIYPHAVLLGEDICDQNGPMVSPDFLAEYYAPQLEYSIEPLLDAGCRPVWHSDGDIRRIVDLLLGAGIQGFQGFQRECGVRLEDLVRKRTRQDEPLIIFGPLSVTTELPVLSSERIKTLVKESERIAHDHASLVLFTANTINPDVPLENVRAMSEAVGALRVS